MRYLIFPYIQGQGQWPGGATPRPRSGGCVGAGGPRGAIPRSRSGGAAVKRYPSSHQVNGHEFQQTPGDGETGEPGVLQPMGSQRVGKDLVTEQQ